MRSSCKISAIFEGSPIKTPGIRACGMRVLQVKSSNFAIMTVMVRTISVVLEIAVASVMLITTGIVMMITMAMAVSPVGCKYLWLSC